MFRRFLGLLGILFLSLYISGCSSEARNSPSLPLEESIKKIIVSKGEGYNFLQDEAYINHMTKLGEKLVTNKNSDTDHYALGHLSSSNIPELVVFQERDKDNLEDEGSLEIYEFNGEKYSLIDSIPMNFDNTNYQIEIGQVSESQYGMFLNNQVGAHSGMTYGFILENKKLKSILSQNKLPLLSVYTDNEIKDINKDGILNFSIVIIDPETKSTSITDSDKITLWYEWDGKDGGELVMIEGGSQMEENTNRELFDKIKTTIDRDLDKSLSLMKEWQDKLSKSENTKLLHYYIGKLANNSENKTRQISNLFEKYQEGKNFDYIFQKYGLSLDKLNSSEYLTREKVLRDEPLLKDNIINNINLGYKVATAEGNYHYLVSYEFFMGIFGENITNEYMDYLNILALNANHPYIEDGGLIISTEELIERILLTESFRFIYPYSDHLAEVHNIYLQYLDLYFYGDLHRPNFDRHTLIINQEALEEFERAADKYQYTNFANIIKDFVSLLENNNNKVNDRLIDDFQQKIS